MAQNYSEFDKKMTRRVLELASFGVGQVSPSPLVGCVIVDESGDIVGEGSYIFDNIIHAEVLPLNQAGERARGATARPARRRSPRACWSRRRTWRR
ncbi:MAG TPA: hypothetical protein PKE69_25440 [Pyrinomonadaceae bacterium]|nr:hypothetical protein [Pyrinomonadaceae bacterium]